MFLSLNFMLVCLRRLCLEYLVIFLNVIDIRELIKGIEINLVKNIIKFKCILLICFVEYFE